ncbi:MAG TPA: rod shape-determining protein MreC [Syntrophomonadaceae bacterium]|nr:rod shape-determining protein MreC [Syntrophomonadaceae bacterium]
MYKIIRSKTLWFSLILLVILLFMVKITSSDRQNITILERTIRNLYTPLQGGVSGVSEFFEGWGNRFAAKESLNRQIAELKKENNRIKLENQVLTEDQAELRRLRKMVNFKQKNSFIYDLIGARIIGRSPDNWYNMVTIDKGSRDGIEQNMSVISPDGLVGRISSVSDNSAQVFLITDREVAVGVVLQETRESNGIVEGLGDNSMLRMRNIPYYSKVKIGERVITSGLSEYYPKGIVIGKIKQIYREPNGLLLSATVAPAVDFNKLEEVFVISAYRPQAEDKAPSKE